MSDCPVVPCPHQGKLACGEADQLHHEVVARAIIERAIYRAEVELLIGQLLLTDGSEWTRERWREWARDKALAEADA